VGFGLSNTYNVSVKFIADLESYIQGVEKGAKKIEEFGKRVQKIGTSLTKNLTLPIVAIGTAAINASLKFNKGMANIASLMPGNIERVKELKDEVLDLAVAVGESPGMLTDGLYEMISAFGDSNDVMRKMKLMAEMAKGGQATLREAIKLTSGVTKAYGDISFEAMQKVSDLSLMVVRLGQTTFPELAAAMGQVVPLAGEMGVKIEEVMAVMATLTGVTGNTSEVSTQFASALTALIKQTDKMDKAISSLGFDTSKAMISELGFVESLKALVGTTDGTTEALAELFGRKEAVLAVLALLGPQVDTFNNKLAQMQDAYGTTGEAVKEQTGGLNAAGFMWDQFKAKIEVVAIKLGDELAPALMGILQDGILPLLDKVTALVKKFSEMDSETQQLILKTLGIITLAGPLLTALGAIITIVGTIIGLIGAVGVGIGAIIGGLTWIITHWDEFTGSWRGAWLEIKRQIIEIGMIFAQLWDEIYTAWVNLWDDIAGYFALQVERIKNKAGELVRGIVKPFEWLKDKLVGHSIVPEMVTAILIEFARMEKGINLVMERVERAMAAAFMPDAVAIAFAKAQGGIDSVSWKFSKAMADAYRGEAGGLADEEIEDEAEEIPGEKTSNVLKDMFRTLDEEIVDAARMLGKSIMSGDIASTIQNIFSMLGNSIGAQMESIITSAVGGGGLFKNIIGALGGGVISGLFGLAGGLFGGGKDRGTTEQTPIFAFITNWEDYFKFGTTLPTSFVYSGRGNAYNVDPHGRTLSGWSTGQHYDS